MPTLPVQANVNPGAQIAALPDFTSAFLSAWNASAQNALRVEQLSLARDEFELQRDGVFLDMEVKRLGLETARHEFDFAKQFAGLRAKVQKASMEDQLKRLQTASAKVDQQNDVDAGLYAILNATNEPEPDELKQAIGTAPAPDVRTTIGPALGFENTPAIRSFDSL